MEKPENIQLVGNMVAIRWQDGREDYLPMDQLRALSPSAENVGEPDLFGRIRGGDSRTEFPDITVTDWEPVGNYALRFTFSDGHNTGLYSFDYLRRIGKELSR